MASKVRTVVDTFFSIDNIKEAHKYAEKGSKSGKIAISIEKQ